jgi:hypothetical protein
MRPCKLIHTVNFEDKIAVTSFRILMKEISLSDIHWSVKKNNSYDKSKKKTWMIKHRMIC